MMMQKIFFFNVRSSGLFLLSWLAIYANAAGQDISLIQNGKSETVIVIAAASSKELQNTAEMLAESIWNATGAKLPIVKDGSLPASTEKTIFLSPLLANELNIEPEDMQGFVIKNANRSIIITGRSDDAIYFGTLEFLEKYFGIRWLFPGKLGEFIPKTADVVIPEEEIRSSPAFLSRQISPFAPQNNMEQYQWSKRNRMISNLSFHHSLNAVFPPEQYGTSHPEFYPELNGKRKVPGVNLKTNWQPCFSQNGTVDVAIGYFRQAFSQNPQRQSASLGVNDNSGFCECGTCLPDPTKLNRLGIPSYSDVYYRWCNQVANGLITEFPDRSFGLLAYTDVIDPPGFPLEPRIVPYICLDRMLWLDPELREYYQAMELAWKDKAANLGWYDYIYGCSFYQVPRVYFRLMAENLRFAQKNRIRYYYAEAYPSEDWTEGPKLYLLFKLLWNPEIDVESTLRDWCRAAVGEKAAEDLYHYYRFWEDFWTVRIARSSWFNSNKHNVFLPFRGLGYLDILTSDDLVYCNNLLDQVVEKAQSEQQRQRAEFLREGFRKKQKRIQAYQNDYVALNQDLQSYRTAKVIEDNAFDHGLNGWAVWQRSYSKAKMALTAKQGHNGKGAMGFHLEKSALTPIVMLKAFEITPGTHYRISAWFRTDNITPETQVQIIIKWKDDQGWIVNRKEGDIADLEANGDVAETPGEWNMLQMAFTAPEKAKYAVVFLQVANGSRGSVYFDDVKMEEIAKENN